MKLISPQAVLIAMLLHGVGANADEVGTSMFAFSGFGNLGVVHSSDKVISLAGHIQ